MSGGYKIRKGSNMEEFVNICVGWIMANRINWLRRREILITLLSRANKSPSKDRGSRIREFSGKERQRGKTEIHLGVKNELNKFII